jgi:hypothetical protein
MRTGRRKHRLTLLPLLAVPLLIGPWLAWSDDPPTGEDVRTVVHDPTMSADAFDPLKKEIHTSARFIDDLTHTGHSCCFRAL